MIGSILHRMILWELVKVFVMALLGITGILLMAGIVAEASQEGLSPAQILAAIPLLIPSTLPYTVPATTLFACCVVYGRLAADNEILAMKSSGVNILQVVRPGLLLGLAASAATMSLYWDVIPLTHRLLRQMVYDDAEELLYSTLRKQKCINYPSMPYAIWVTGIEGHKLFGVFIEGRNPQGDSNFYAMAKEAELRVDMPHKKLSIRMRFGTAMSKEGAEDVTFDARELEVDLPPAFESDGLRRARDMTWMEMLDRRKELEKQAKVSKEGIVALQNQGAALPPASNPDAGAQASNLQRAMLEQDYIQQQILLLDVEMQMRPALSLGCFCFVLVGCPVGIWFSRSDYLSSFIVCFLPIVITYYPLTLCGAGMAKDGHMNMALMIWGSNLVMGVIGAGLYWRLLRN